MENFESMLEFHKIFFVFVSIFVVFGFIFVLALMFSPKLRGKFLGKQVQAMRHMTDYTKEDLEQIQKNLGAVAIKAKKDILDENEDTLKDMANKQANINKDAIKTTVGAIKEGFTGNAVMFCKHCGATIDSDSKFCKKCGKEQ